jgi:hypothetical protein
MDDPIYRNGYWWQHDGSDWRKWDKTGWKTQNKQDYPFPPPPSRWRRWQITGSEPFQVYLLGILAAIATLGITLAVVSNKSLVAAILAPVIGVIGVFTGHAAGHSSAVAVMKEVDLELANVFELPDVSPWRFGRAAVP